MTESEPVAIYQWREPAVSGSWLDSSGDYPRKHLERLAKLPGVETRIVYTHQAEPEGAQAALEGALKSAKHGIESSICAHHKEGDQYALADQIIEHVLGQLAAQERNT